MIVNKYLSINSPEDAERDKIHDHIDAPDSYSDGAEDNGGYKVILDILAQPEDNSEEGDKVGNWPDHGPDGVLVDEGNDVAEGHQDGEY